MKYYFLASGSKGNACLLDFGNFKIMIDCGTTKRYLMNSFETLGFRFEDVDAVFITHDHSDHTSQINLFKDAHIFSPSLLKIEHEQITPYVEFKYKDLNVLPIRTSHDAECSVGYVIFTNNLKIVYITDTGYIRPQDLELIKDADFYFMESNHDPHMLMTTPRPYYIKQRILSDEGHLSNEDASDILRKVVSDKTKEVILAHLSQQANKESLALEVAMKNLEDTSVVIKAARQFEIVSGGIK